jgi:hypothetical protein
VTSLCRQLVVCVCVFVRVCVCVCMYVSVLCVYVCMYACIMAQQLDGNRHTERPVGAFKLRPVRFCCSPNRELWEGNQMLS